MPTPGFVIVAIMRAKEGHVEALRHALFGLVGPTRAEDGCVQYDLHQDQQDPATFLFYEIWKDRPVWLQHMETPHLQSFRNVAGDLLESPPRILEMTQIEPA
ncbi:MAG: antibiotic biosynthesis monooxygenase [Bryobacterales bacterium]|jgi:quinol monooxygenase YgiN|nr:antibiotic biosynthesis monooxygenase [Bryobacterales bacterium]